MSTRGSAGTPLQGVNAVIELTPPAGGSTNTIKNSKWSLELIGNAKEAPNTSDGMLRAGGLFDYKINFEGDTDTTTTSTSIEAQVTPNSIWDFKLYRSKTASTYFAGTIIIINGPKPETGCDMVEHWTIEAGKCYGPLILPNGSTL